MVDREKVLAVLTRRFPGAHPDQLAAAANAIVGLDDQWEDATEPTEWGRRADDVRIFRRRKSGNPR
jgi:hypothetical protein